MRTDGDTSCLSGLKQKKVKNKNNSLKKFRFFLGNFVTTWSSALLSISRYKHGTRPFQGARDLKGATFKTFPMGPLLHNIAFFPL